jgi:hypothetical protein
VGRNLKICPDRITKQVDDAGAELKRQYQKQENSENRAKAAQTNRENKGKERRVGPGYTLGPGRRASQPVTLLALFLIEQK